MISKRLVLILSCTLTIAMISFVFILSGNPYQVITKFEFNKQHDVFSRLKPNGEIENDKQNTEDGIMELKRRYRNMLLLQRSKILENKCVLYPYNKSVVKQPTRIRSMTELNFTTMPVFIYPKSKIFYCDVPKCASTTLLSAMLKIDKNYTIQNIGESYLISFRDYIRTTPNYLSKKRRAKYFKFMFVRHPFSRLITFYSEKKTDERIVGPMKKKVRNSTMYKKNDMITFREVVQYLIETPIEMYDEHIMPYSLLCQPCVVKYDFIGRMESFNEDKKALFDIIGATMERHEHYNRNNYTDSEWQSYFSELTQSQVHKLYMIYYYDFKLFDYSPELFSRFARYE